MPIHVDTIESGLVVVVWTARLRQANDEGARPIAILANIDATYVKTVRDNRRHAKADGLAVEPRRFSLLF
jgi:hypothetical protein